MPSMASRPPAIRKCGRCRSAGRSPASPHLAPPSPPGAWRGRVSTPSPQSDSDLELAPWILRRGAKCSSAFRSAPPGSPAAAGRAPRHRHRRRHCWQHGRLPARCRRRIGRSPFSAGRSAGQGASGNLAGMRCARCQPRRQPYPRLTRKCHPRHPRPAAILPAARWSPWWRPAIRARCPAMRHAAAACRGNARPASRSRPVRRCGRHALLERR